MWHQSKNVKLKRTKSIKNRKGYKGRRERNVVVKFKHAESKKLIFSNVNNLQGKENVKKQLFRVYDDMDPEAAERRQKFRELRKENNQLDEEDRLDVRMVKDKILVNNQELVDSFENAYTNRHITAERRGDPRSKSNQTGVHQRAYREKLRILHICSQDQICEGSSKRFP